MQHLINVPLTDWQNELAVYGLQIDITFKICLNYIILPLSITPRLIGIWGKRQKMLVHSAESKQLLFCVFQAVCLKLPVCFLLLFSTLRAANSDFFFKAFKSSVSSCFLISFQQEAPKRYL